VNRLIALTAAAVAALSLTIVPASAAAARPASAASSAAAASPPTTHVLSLHAAFERALATTRAGTPSGVVPPRGAGLSRAARPAAAASCTEPNCDLSYGGGPVQTTPHVYLLEWGPWWQTSAADAASSYLENFYEGLGVQPDDTWSTTTSQYSDGSGSPSFKGSVFAGVFVDTSTPPTSVTPDDLAAEAISVVSKAKITDLTDAQIVVAAQSGTCFSDGFAGSCGTASSTGSYCGWHDYAVGGGLTGDLPFVNLPYQPDAGAYCGENWVNSGAAGTYDGFSTVGGHEYAETITDPEPDTGWTDPSDTISDGGAPGEVADKCIWGGSIWGALGSDPYGDVTLSTGSFAMQSLWSNAAGRCVMTTTPSLTVTTPATQRSTLGVRVSFRIHAVTNAGLLHYTATGLPAGLALNKATGAITGIPAVTAGTSAVHVTVSEYAGSRTVSFSWQVGSRSGAVTGYHRLCADDYDGRKGNGNKIDVWSCDGQTRQKIIFTASGELLVAGKCITSGHGVVLEPCTGSTAQTWTRRSNGEYVVKGRCLTDPRNSTKNGTQLGANVCTDSASQHWSLP
jgi:Ricin-type beta-trefoil lectin domain/Putative Ig domain